MITRTHRTVTAAVVETAGGGFRLDDVELDDPRPDEVLVRVEAVGVCHTDVKLAALGVPEPPAVLGHEGAGVVERVGSAVSRFRPGDRVVASFAWCGGCAACTGGHPASCDHFAALNMGGLRPDGSSPIHRAGEPIRASFFGQSSFATHSIVAERNLVALDDDVPFEIAAPLGCGLQTGAGAVVNLRPISFGSTVIVFGAGAVGMGALFAARAHGAVVVAVDPVESRRDLAVQLGAVAAVDPADPDLVEHARGAAGRGFDLALDTSGVSASHAAAFEALDRGGTLVLAAGGSPDVTVPMAGLQAGKVLRGITEGDAVPRRFIPLLVELWRRGLFPVERLIETFPLAGIGEAVAAAHAGTTIKPVLLPHG